MMNSRWIAPIAGVVIAAAVAAIYAEAARSYFLDDDFHWLAGVGLFEWRNLIRLENYSHFYRPVIEIYYYTGRQLVGCDAYPFHLASIGIHLFNIGVLFAFASVLTKNVLLASIAALLFAVQPGYVEAVAWVAAITDLLPATWYLLTLLLHLRFVQTRNYGYYAASLLPFTLCLLTHESSATLIVMMLALELLVVVERDRWPALRSIIGWIPRYLPFATLLSGFLVIAYVVNSRSYLVQDGHYAFGLHAIEKYFHYFIALYVGKRMMLSYVFIVAALGALLWWGTARTRFFVFWILLTILPVSFFTWGIASRYLYMPAAGFALLLADRLVAAYAIGLRRYPSRLVATVMIVVVAFLSVRFALFAQKGSVDFRNRTRPYERLAAAVRAANPSPARGAVIFITPADVENVPEIYVDPAGEIANCSAPVDLVPR